MSIDGEAMKNHNEETFARLRRIETRHTAYVAGAFFMRERQRACAYSEVRGAASTPRRVRLRAEETRRLTAEWRGA